MKSQVPSISQKRAMQRSFYTSTMPAPVVKLDNEVYIIEDVIDIPAFKLYD